jgi:hypothetical protein
MATQTMFRKLQHEEVLHRNVTACHPNTVAHPAPVCKERKTVPRMMCSGIDMHRESATTEHPQRETWVLFGSVVVGDGGEHGTAGHVALSVA